jgi:hypothetical protein
MVVKLLQDSRDIFAWNPTDVVAVPRELIEHTLNIDPSAKPIKQKLRQFAQV